MRSRLGATRSDRAMLFVNSQQFQTQLGWHFPRRLSQWLAIGLLATSGSLCGLTVDFGASAPVQQATAFAQANTVSEDEVRSYAASVLQMDEPRTAAYTQVKDLLMQANLDISQIDMTCTNTRDLGNIPRQIRQNVRQIMVSYCNEARQIVELNGLSVSRFNMITQAHANDPVLADQIRNALIQIQQQSRQ